MGSLAFRQNYASIIPGRHKLSRAISHKLAARIQPEILRRKKAVFRRNTLCISRAIPYKSARESGERFFVRKRWKTAGILCVFQGQYRIIGQGDLTRNFSSQICCENAEILCVFQTFRSEFVEEKNRQSPQTQLCGVTQGFPNEFLAEKIRQNPQTHLCGVALYK